MSLSTGYTTDTGVHLTQLIRERVKASIHALKLRHDGLQGHTNYREEEVKVEEAKEEEGTTEEARASVSVRGYFSRSWASLRRIEPDLMAPLVVK